MMGLYSGKISSMGGEPVQAGVREPPLTPFERDKQTYAVKPVMAR